MCWLNLVPVMPYGAEGQEKEANKWKQYVNVAKDPSY